VDTIVSFVVQSGQVSEREASSLSRHVNSFILTRKKFKTFSDFIMRRFCLYGTGIRGCIY